MKILQSAAVLAAVAATALSAGCATRLEMGPGYYHYDSRLATSVDIPPSVQEPVVVYQPSPAPSRD